MDNLQQRKGYRRVFKENRLTLGLFIPIESYSGSFPTMERQIQMVQKAEKSGFGAVWVRDIPLYDPYFGDVGQIYDPWVYLGYLSAHTEQIALGTASIIFALRHPIHTAKAAASIDHLSKGRLLLGVASGDRPIEFPAFNVGHASRGETFVDSFNYFNALLEKDFASISNSLGTLNGNAGVVPKPYTGKIPLFITGTSRQTLEWIGQNGDGWMYYPRNLAYQSTAVESWRRVTPYFKPFMQSLYIDLTEDPDATPTPIHLGFRIGSNHLISFLKSLEAIGVNHVILNVKYGQRDINDVMEELSEVVLPEFPSITE
ncbi:MAG TPA: LLM class oxidoreductase [Bacillota bacterium]|nr:LLM class oxidoreductase [Bacillota bacterium]